MTWWSDGLLSQTIVSASIHDQTSAAASISSIAPFPLKTEAWFDPQDKWRFVAGEFRRYFGGPRCLGCSYHASMNQIGN